MIQNRQKETQINKIIHLLSEKVENLPFLNKLNFEEMETFYSTLVNAIHGDNSPLWARLGQISKFMPNFINSKIAQDILGPQITANLTYHIPLKDALSISRSIKTKFLAEVAEYLIPEKTKELINAYPIELLKELTKEMVKQDKYFIMAGFVDLLPVEKIIKLSDAIPIEEDMIKISSFIQNKKYIAQLVALYTDDKIIKLLKAAHKIEKWAEMLEISQYLDDEQMHRMANVVTNLSIDEIITAVKTAEENNMLESLQIIIDKVKSKLPAGIL